MSPLCGALQRVVRAPPLISSGPPVVEGAAISSLIIEAKNRLFVFFYKWTHTWMAEISFSDVIFFMIFLFFLLVRQSRFNFTVKMSGIIVKYRLTNMTSPQFEIRYQHAWPTTHYQYQSSFKWWSLFNNTKVLLNKAKHIPNHWVLKTVSFHWGSTV